MKGFLLPVVLGLATAAAAVSPELSAEGVWSVPVVAQEAASDIPLDAAGRCTRLLKIDRVCNLEDTILSFDYRLPPNSAARVLNVFLHVKEWQDKRIGIKLVPVRGKWRTETFPLARLMQGDRWRMGGARTASSLGLEVVGGEKDDCAEFANVRLSHRPTAFSPLVRPEWFVGGGAYRRSFAIVGKPEKSWVMAYGRNAFEVKANGRLIGKGPVSTEEQGWLTRGSLDPAADQWTLDGLLKEGANVIDFVFSGGAKDKGLVVLGWVADGRRHVIVSDGFWAHDEGMAKTESMSVAERPGNLDIYPLRGADAWCRSARRGAYDDLPSYAPTNLLLTVHPADGSWGTGRDETGRWFFRTPSGRPFFYYAIQTVNALWGNYAYANWMRRAYPNETEWAEDAVGLVQRLGFNGVGVAATSEKVFQSAARRGLVNLQNIGCGDGGPFLVNAHGERQWGLADPFDPAFEKTLRRRLTNFAKAWNARPDIFAICVGNEALIEGNILDRPSAGYVYSAACGVEFVRWLKVRYQSDLAALNAAWFGPLTARHLSSFDDVLVRKPDPHKDMPRIDDPEFAAAMAHLGKAGTAKGEESRMKSDFDAFAVHVVRAYAEKVLALMREFFPRKLIVSNRFMGGATREMYACWKGYDAIAVNTYPLDTWGDAVFNGRKVRLLRDAHEATGRPVLLTEWGVQGMDVNMQSPAAQLYTQAERGRGYGKVLRQVVETMPFVAGVVDFGYQHLADSEGQGWGIVDSQGRPYRDYLEGMILAVRWLDGYLQAKGQIRQTTTNNTKQEE